MKFPEGMPRRAEKQEQNSVPELAVVAQELQRQVQERNSVDRQPDMSGEGEAWLGDPAPDLKETLERLREKG